MNTPFWRPLPAKLRLYEALYALNRGFEDTLVSLERLEHLGIFRLDHLNAFKVAIERTRAEANEELVQTLQSYEEDQSARFDHLEREWKKQYEDPDDVFLSAQARKQEIKDQIRNLQKGLVRQHSGRKARAKKRR
jgi:hypothetical protein